MYDEAYLAECHVVYCQSKVDKYFDSREYFLASYYIGVKLYWSIMYYTHGGL